MTSYLHYKPSALEVNTNASKPDEVAVRLWVGWDLVDASGRATDTIFGGYIDIDKAYPVDHYHVVVGNLLKNFVRLWEGSTETNSDFIFAAIVPIMEVLGDDQS